jgi:hypothetical protein
MIRTWMIKANSCPSLAGLSWRGEAAARPFRDVDAMSSPDGQNRACCPGRQRRVLLTTCAQSTARSSASASRAASVNGGRAPITESNAARALKAAASPGTCCTASQARRSAASASLGGAPRSENSASVAASNSSSSAIKARPCLHSSRSKIAAANLRIPPGLGNECVGAKGREGRRAAVRGRSHERQQRAENDERHPGQVAPVRDSTGIWLKGLLRAESCRSLRARKLRPTALEQTFGRWDRPKTPRASASAAGPDGLGQACRRSAARGRSFTLCHAPAYPAKAAGKSRAAA